MRSQVDHSQVSAKCAEPNCQTGIDSGERAFYYPGDKAVYGTRCGHGEKAERDFNAHQVDETDSKSNSEKELEVIVMSINKAIVVGNLGRDPEVRALPSGQNVANFSLATTERFTDRSGTKQQRTEWHRVVAFGPLADTCQRFLSKGRQVYIEGRLTTRQYEAKDGSGKRYRTEIVARQLRMLGNRANAPKAEASDDIPF